MCLGTVIYSRTNQQVYQDYISVGKILPRKSSKKKKKNSSEVFERDSLFHITEELGF